MALTPNDIIEGAYAKSTKNDPDTISTDATELLGVVQRAVRRAFSLMARVNPVWIATTQTVAFAGSGWTRPATAQSILRVELETGAEVKVVPFNDRTAEASLRAVYRLGNTFYSAGNANDPTSGNLVFWFARFPVDPAGLASNIDSLFPDHFAELLMFEVALHLATKDGRSDELPGLTAERDAWEELLEEFLEHETANESRRFDLLNRFQTGRKRPMAGRETR